MATAVDRDRRVRGEPELVRQIRRASPWLPIVVMAASLVGLLAYCHGLLHDAVRGVPVAVGGLGFWLSIGGFFASCLAAVVMHCARLSWKVAGPEYRLCRALQRIRSNDVGFRVSLRRGDLLTGLARECNELLDWLNRNPPAGSRTGGDVVEVEAEVAVGEPAGERGDA